MRTAHLILFCLVLSLSHPLVNAQAQNLAVNPGFEELLSVGWQDIWTRDPDVATVSVVGDAHSGSNALQVEHTGSQDWSITQSSRISVAASDIFELSGWMKCTDLDGEANYSVVTRDAGDQVLDWVFGPASMSGTHDWEQVLTHFICPDACASIELRIVGWGPGEMWFDDISLVKEGNINDLRGPPEDLEFGNDAVTVVFHTGSATFTVTDERTDRVYDQLPLPELPACKAAELGPDGHSLTAHLWHPASDLSVDLTLSVPETSSIAELCCEIAASGSMSEPLAYPAPFATDDDTFLVIPMNEGIMFPAGDPTVDPNALWLIGYGGHGISMAWFGQIQGETGPGVMAIIETPDDMRVDCRRPSADPDQLHLWSLWQPSRGEFAYPRAITYLFLADGGYVSQAKRYREYANEVGLYKSLRAKQAENPNVDLLIGAVNVWAPSWYGNYDPLGLIQEMRALGIERILWSEGTTPEIIRAMNEMPGVLTSRYDIYQDVWAPGEPEWARHEGWPEDLVWLPDCSIMQGWVIRDGENEYPGGVVCSPRGLEHAQEQIPADLATHPYRCRFIDTTTASPWRECYNPEHPTSRSEDRYYKMELLRFCSEDMAMVTGSETGIDASVPYLHYFEGMLSLGPYRLPDCGYTLIDYKEPTPEFLKYQVGPYYRVPLWELVYHDCTVSYWYWGDSSNKAPEVWDERDLFNLLYGTPPLFMITPDVWATYGDRFVQCYQSVCPTVRTIGYDEMLSHEFLTDDHTLQRTTWSSGLSIVVNFSDEPQALPDGTIVPAMGSAVVGCVFDDVPADFWAFAEILRCVQAGIVGGYPDGLYRPQRVVNRDQMAVYISRAIAGGDGIVPEPGGEPAFPDVSADHWAYKHIEYAVHSNVVEGYPDGNYHPDWQLNRAQMAVFIARSIVTPTGEAGLADYQPPAVPSFSDVPIHSWSYRHIEYCAENSIVAGYADGFYRPSKLVTRDQMAVYVARACELPL
jgi:hypothetical protein